MTVAQQLDAFFKEAERLRRIGAFEDIAVTFKGGLTLMNPSMKPSFEVSGEKGSLIVTVPWMTLKGGERP